MSEFVRRYSKQSPRWMMCGLAHDVIKVGHRHGVTLPGSHMCLSAHSSVSD
jgi:hypothetical protein